MKKEKIKKAFLIVIVFMLVISVFAGALNNVSAQGDGFDDAEEIDVPGEWSGELNSTNEQDFYKFEVEASQIIGIEFSSEAGNDVQLTLYNADREEEFSLQSSEGSPDSDDLSLRNETPTDFWFIGIEGVTAGGWEGNYSFNVTIDSQDDAGSGVDVSGSWDDAYEIVEGEHVGQIRDLDDKDMYKMEVEPSQIIELEFISEAGNDVQLTLYNADREEEFSLQSSEGSPDSDSLSLRNETPTDFWFIEIEGATAGGWDGEYTFNIMIDSQDDAGTGGDVSGTFDEALEVEKGEYKGQIKDLDEEDMYKVWLEPDSVIEIEFISESTDGQGLALLDHERNPVFDLQSSDGSMEEDSHTLDSDVDADFWFIGVGGNDGHYTFNVNLDMPEPEFEFSNLRADPEEVYVDQDVELKLDVSNVGTGPGDYSVEFYVDDESVGEDTVEDVEIDETKTATVIYTPDATGNYNAEAEGLTAEFTVEEVETVEGTIIVDGDGEVILESYNEESGVWEEHPDSPVEDQLTDQTSAGTQVRLTADPDVGYEFDEWTGDAAGTSDEITITMDEDKTITANFEEETTNDGDYPDFIQEYIEKGMWCFALLIIIPILIIIVIIVVLVKLLKGGD
ncbi:MAG: InlB B-repeat-containing protein, partial [Thermoplasmata archaeon]